MKMLHAQLEPTERSARHAAVCLRLAEEQKGRVPLYVTRYRPHVVFLLDSDVSAGIMLIASRLGCDVAAISAWKPPTCERPVSIFICMLALF